MFLPNDWEFCRNVGCGDSERMAPIVEQDRLLAALLKRLWRKPPIPRPFRHLSEMVAVWCKRTLTDSKQWPDPGLVKGGLRLLSERSGRASTDVLLATDPHGANVLKARREPWLAIDPRPFVGDPAYDATQHLINNVAGLRADPKGRLGAFASSPGWIRSAFDSGHLPVPQHSHDTIGSWTRSLRLREQLHPKLGVISILLTPRPPLCLPQKLEAHPAVRYCRGCCDAKGCRSLQE
jgi:hypothetical protein